MMRATWNGVVLAESDRTIRLEGNHYFPIEDLHQEYLRPSSTHTRCAWKGVASYYTIDVEGKLLPDGAWYYPNPSVAATRISRHVAFWRGVRVERVSDDGNAGRPSLVARLLGRRAS